MRTINEIILHCAATKPSMDIGAKEIREWHVNGRGWNDIGYHFVIRRNGHLETGRDIAIAGAHCKGHNAHSIGICLVGGLSQDGKRAEDNFELEQFDTLTELLNDLIEKFPSIEKIRGHCDYDNKDCPVFDYKNVCKTIGLGKYVGKN